MKRILTTILSVIMLFCVSMFVLTACDGCGEKITEKPQEQVEAFVNLSLAEKQLIVGDEALLVATTPLIDGLSVAWASSDANVATVSGDGVVTAMRPGTADITATFGDKTATCKISVSLGSILPSIEFENQIVNDTVNVAKQTEINLGAFVKFNGKSFNDATFTYSIVSGADKASVTSAGKFTAGNEKGQILVEVKASWRGIESPELTKLITVNVISSNAILIDQGKTSSLTLYTTDLHGGNAFNITESLVGRITAFEDDIDKTSEVSIRITKPVLGVFSNDPSVKVATYDAENQIVSAHNFGSAVLELSFMSTDGKFVVEYPINVVRPVADYADTMELFSILDGEAKGSNKISFADVFGNPDVALLDAYQGGDEFNGSKLTITDGKVLGFRTENRTSLTEDVIVVYDQQVGYAVNVEAYAKVIEEYSDFAVFHGTKNVDGYVVLLNNIEYDNSLDGLSSSASFTGTFEGNGYYINARTVKGGLFNTLVNATIQNTAFLFTSIGEGADRYLLGSGSSKNNNVLRDVLIDVDIKYNSTTNYSIFGQSTLTTVDYHNVIVDFAPGTLVRATAAHRYGGVFEDYTNSANFTKKDTDFNGDGALDYSYNADTFDNVYYINSDFRFAGFYHGNDAVNPTAVYFAENDGEFYNSVKDSITPVSRFAFYPGLIRYDNYGKMLAANNNYATFNTEVWDLSDGIPKFKSVSYPTEIQVDATLELTVGVKETATLSAFLFGSTEAPVYSCATNDVVTVDATTGVVTAVGIGTAEISVAIGSKTATCAVTVVWANDTAPVLTVDGLSDAEPVYINYSDTKEFIARLTYNGAEVDGVTFNWSSAIGGSFADATVGSFVAPDSYADGNLRVTVTYYGVSFDLSFRVLVATDPEMMINGAEPTDIELYTNATWGGDYVTEVDFVPSSAVAGVTITDISTDDDSVAIFNDGKIQSVGVGETYAVVTFLDSQNNTIIRKVKITVLESIKEIADVLDYSAIDGKIIGIEEYFEEQGEVVIDRASMDGTALTVETGNVITGIDGNSNTVQSVQLIVGAGTKSIKVNVNVYKMIIDEDDDFSVFRAQNITGYFKVANDIILDSWTGNVCQSGGTGIASFKGVFDGDGHTVEVALKSWGIFGVTSDAIIKNTAFIVKKVGSQSFGYAAILANQMTTTQVIDCYFEYDLPAGTVIDVAYSGWGQSAGVGVYNSAGNNTRFYNVIIDTSKLQLKNTDAAYAYGSLMSKATNNKSGGVGSGTWQTVTHDVYVISNFKYLSYNITSSPTPGNQSGMISGITGISAIWFAENEVELYNAQKNLDGSELSEDIKKIIEGTKRYDSYTDFAAAKAQNDYSTFSTEIWDLSGGFPIFKSALSRFDFYYIGGSATATSAKLSSEGEGESVTINANIKGVSYIPTLSIVSGSEFITINGNVVKAVTDAFGQAVVKATYNIADNIVEKEYTINVIGEAWSGDAIKYSTLDSRIYFDGELEEIGVASVIDANTSAVYYEDGFVTAEVDALANNAGTDLRDYTTKAIITLVDGTQYAIDIISYTKILTQSSDFAIFHSTSGATINGYYLLGNDITLDGSWDGNASQSGGASKATFKGVFDGDGHVAEIALKAYGVFGTISEGEIKDTAFIVKQIGGKEFAYASILAYRMENSTVSNCYFEYDLPTGTTVDPSYFGYGQSAGIGVYNASGVNVKFNNVIINTSKLETAMTSYSQPFAYGAIKAQADNSQTYAYVTKTTNTYVISANKYISYKADVLSKDNTINQFLGDQYIWFAENDTADFEAYNDQVGTIKKLVNGTKRYDNVAAFAADAENNDYTSFDASIWDTTSGYPVFKSVLEYEHVKAVNNAEYFIGGSKNVTDVVLESTQGNSLTVYANYNEQQYIPTTLRVISGADYLAINSNVITVVAGAYGDAVVEAVYNIEGVRVVKTYNIAVSLELLGGNIKYSTLDDKLYLPEVAKLEGATIATIADYEGTIFFQNGASVEGMPENTTNSLDGFVKNVVVTLADGTRLSSVLTSYTKVLTRAEDLLMFNLNDGNAETSTEILINGYYVLGNDIVGTETLTFLHEDAKTEWNNTTTGFAGVFDGDGHKITVSINTNGGSEKSGIFGQLQGRATIKNVAFVDCTINKGVLLFTAIKNNTYNALLENVYINISNVASAGTYGGGAWYQTSYLNLQGVVIDNDVTTDIVSNGKTTAEILAGGASTAANHGHGAYVSNEWSAHAERIKGLIVISEAPLSYKRPSASGHQVAVGCNAGYTNNATVTCGCAEGSVVTIKVLNGVYHYATLLELSNKTTEIAGILSNYSSDYWTIVNGYPVFKGLEDRVATDMISSTEYYLGGSKGATETTLENTSDSSIDVYAIFNSKTYEPQLTIVEGNSVTVSGKTITVVNNATGNTTVKATYVINGVTVEKTYTISVVPQEKAGVIAYSTLDNKYYLPENIENDEITEIKETVSGDVYFANNAMDASKVPQNTESNDLTDYTKKVIVTLADGSNYSITMISYTMVISKAEDFKVFEKNSELNPAETKSGYYILGNNITLGETSWTGNTYGDSSTGSTFKGVLDGQGHVAEIIVKNNGLLGSLEAATVKNIALIIKGIGSSGYNKATALGLKGASSRIIDTYIAYDLPEGTKVDVSYFSWGQTSGLGLFAWAAHNTYLTRVVVDMSGVELVCTQKENAFAYGSLLAKPSKQTSITPDPISSDVYVISNFKYLGFLAAYSPSGASSYTDYLGIDKAIFASNDTEAYDNCVVVDGGVKKLIAGTYRYDNLGAFAGAQGNTYTSFDSSIWNTSNGFPIFNAVYDEVYGEYVASADTYIGGSKGTEAQLQTRAGESVDVYATFKNQNYQPSLVVKTGDDLVSVAGNVISVKEGAGEGTATIEATFNITGVTFTKTFTVTLVGAGLTGQLYYSTSDNQFFFTNSEFASKEVTKVVDFDTPTTVYYENGSANTAIKNTTNEVTSYTKWVTVTCADGTEGKIQLISYAKVINEANDLKALIDASGTSSEPAYVTGYFALLSDIIVDDTYVPAAADNSYFTGVLDGNGHTIKNLVVGANGLIGGVGVGGQIKNLAITVTSASTGATGLIANKSKLANNTYTHYDGTNANSVFLIDNCYFDIDFAWNGDTSSLFGLSALAVLGLNMTNSVIDVANGIFTAPTATGTNGYGVLYNNFAAGAVSNQIGDYYYFGKISTTNKYVLFENTYYVNNDYMFMFVKNHSIAAQKLALICENDSASVTSISSSGYKVALVSGLNRYASVAELPSAATTVRPSANA